MIQINENQGESVKNLSCTVKVDRTSKLVGTSSGNDDKNSTNVTVVTRWKYGQIALVWLSKLNSGSLHHRSSLCRVFFKNSSKLLGNYLDSDVLLFLSDAVP